MPTQHVDQKIAWLPTTDVQPNPKNRNAHSAEQVKRLAKLIEHYGWRKPLIVSNQSGQLVVGHGRLLAAKLLKAEQVPVVYQDFTPEDEYGFAVADNAIAAWAELDLAGINTDVGELGPDFDIDLLGLDGFTLDVSEKYGDAEPATLAERLLVPPFSVLDARQGYWQDRKRQWLALGIKSEVGRGGGLLMTAPEVTSENLNYYRQAGRREKVAAFKSQGKLKALQSGRSRPTKSRS